MFLISNLSLQLQQLTSSVMEEDLGPLAQVVSSLVEIVSLVETSSPLDELLVLLGLGVFSPEISVVEFLFPTGMISLTINS
mgnify:CR=1 FL=1